MYFTGNLSKTDKPQERIADFSDSSQYTGEFPINEPEKKIKPGYYPELRREVRKEILRSFLSASETDYISDEIDKVLDETPTTGWDEKLEEDCYSRLRNINKILKKFGTPLGVPEILIFEDELYERECRKETNGCYCRRIMNINPLAGKAILKKSLGENARILVGVHESIHYNLERFNYLTHRVEEYLFYFSEDCPGVDARKVVTEGFTEFLTEKAVEEDLRTRAHKEMEHTNFYIPYILGNILFKGIERVGGIELALNSYKNCRTAHDLLNTVVLATRSNNNLPPFEHHQSLIRNLHKAVKKRIEELNLDYNKDDLNRMLFWD